MLLDACRRVNPLSLVEAARLWWAEATCTRGLDDVTAGRVRAHQLRAVFRLNGLSTAVTLVIAAVVSIRLGDLSPEGRWAWLAAVGFILAVQFRRCILKRNFVSPRIASETAVRSLERGAAYLAITWGAVPLIFQNGATPAQQVLLAVVTIGMMFGGALALAALPRAAIIFASLMTGAILFAVFTGPATALLSTSIVLAAFLAIIAATVVTLGQQAARHVADQQLIADAAAEQKRLREAMLAREARASAIAAKARPI